MIRINKRLCDLYKLLKIQETNDVNIINTAYDQIKIKYNEDDNCKRYLAKKMAFNLLSKPHVKSDYDKNNFYKQALNETMEYNYRSRYCNNCCKISKGIRTGYKCKHLSQ